MTSAKHRQRGVTLLEALIAVALLAALSTMLASAVHSATRLSAKTLSQAEDNESLRIAEDALRQILGNAIVLNAAEPRFRVTGDSKALSVTSLAGTSVARRFILNIDNGQLIGKIAAVNKDNIQGETTEILAAAAKGFSYYGRTRPDAPLRWTNEWNSALPPKMVRLEIADRDSGDRKIIEVAVTVSAPLHCAFDPVSRRCRN